MAHRTLTRRILPFFMSLTLLAGTLPPAVIFAQPETGVVSDNSVPEDVITDDAPDEAYAPNAEPAADPAKEDASEEALSPEGEENAENTITIRLVDADGVTPLCDPVTKDLSAAADKSRYLFDKIDASGASVPDMSAFQSLPSIHNGVRISAWISTATGNKYSYKTLTTSRKFNASDTLTAVYAAANFTFSIEYDKDGGEFDFTDQPDASAPTSFKKDSASITFPSAYKSGYIFKGWQVTNESAHEAYGKMLSGIGSGSYIDYTCGEYLKNNEDSGTENVFTGYRLKAIFEKIEIPTPTVSSVKNTKSGVAVVKIASPGSSSLKTTYELCYAGNKNFKKTTAHIVDLGTKTSYKITNMPKGRTYYFKVRSRAVDPKGNTIYTPYSPVATLKITKGVTESKKASKKSAKLSASQVKIDGEKNLYVSATVKKRLKSYDDFYYLVSVDPNTGKILKAVADSDKMQKAVFKTPVRDEKGKNLINGKYAVAIKTGKKKFKQISNAYFIANPEDAADYTAAYPTTKSKKGIQGSLNTGLGVQQGFMNFSINNILSADAKSGTKYVYNGKTYYFSEPYSAISYASACNQAGITCSMQLMLNWPGSGKYSALLFGTKSASSKTNLYAINASTTKSREIVEAAFSFLADRLSKEDCHVDNWILGNEVNIYKDWYYAGSTGHDAFMKNYAHSFRILYNSVKGRSKNAHVFICTDHTWKNRSGDWGAKPFMESFNKEIKAMNKKIQWNLAYHAYPAILYIPTAWKDSLAPNSENADFVSPRNLNILTDHVRKTYGKNTRIIISECGFTNAEGEAAQAAALAYSFYKAQFNDMVDAFIIRTENDVPGEKLTKLNGEVIEANFGLCNANGKKRASYDVFKYMDTPDYEKHTKGCLSTIGQSSWSSIIPGFSDKTLKSMPRR